MSNRSARSRVTDLTKRQQQVLQLLLQGQKEQVVAQALRLSVNTVHTHVKNIYKQLGVQSRAMLMAKFILSPIAKRRTKP